MVPQIAFDFPVPDRIDPFQKYAADGALQGEKQCGQNHQPGNRTGKEPAAAKKDDVRNYVAKENEQAIGQAEAFLLVWQEVDSLIKRRIAGQQNAKGCVQGEDGKAHGRNKQALHLSEKEGKHAGNTPHCHCICEIIFMSHKIPEQIAPYQIMVGTFYGFKVIFLQDKKGIVVCLPGAVHEKVNTG